MLQSQSSVITPVSLNMELDKVHRLLLSHNFSEKLYAKRKMIYKRSKQTINFRVSFTKELPTLIENAQTHINNIRGVKFYFAALK